MFAVSHTCTHKYECMCKTSFDFLKNGKEYICVFHKIFISGLGIKMLHWNEDFKNAYPEQCFSLS